MKIHRALRYRSTGYAILSGALLLLGPNVRADLAIVPPASTVASRFESSQTSSSPSATQKQQVYLGASLNERIRISEEIGEAGAEAFARSKGLSPLLLESQKSNIHGPDQIWTDSRGRIYVIEAKGGTGALKTGYGFTQGSAEYAVAASKELLKRAGSSAAERAGAAAVLKAALEGRMTVWVVRTPHSLGEPLGSILEKEAGCSKAVEGLARAAAKEMGIAESPIQKLLATGKKVVLKVGGGAGVVGGGFQTVQGVNQIRTGDVLEGSLNVGIGSGNVAAGTMIMLGKTVGGATLGAGMAVADGGKDVCLGLVNGDTGQSVVGTIKMASGAAMCTGQPVLVVIGGVTYAGVLIYDNREAIKAGGRDALGWAQDQFDRAWNATGGIANRTKEVLGNAKDGAWNIAASAGQTTASAADDAFDATWNAGAWAINASGSAARSAKDHTWNASAGVIQKIRGAVTSATTR